MTLTSYARAQSSDNSLIAEVEAAIVKQTNDFRNEHKLPPLKKNKELTAAANKFAQFMAESGKYGHRADGRTPAQRAKAAGYKYCVVRENIAYRTNTGEVTIDGLIEVFVQGWIESPPHRENMLADYVSETGVGVATADGATYFAVQLFGRPKSAAIKLRVTNESAQTRTLIVRANDSEDEVELPPNIVITMTRCFPTELQVAGSTSELKLTESAELAITDEGLTR